MGLMDVQGFGNAEAPEPLKLSKPAESFKANNFDRSITSRISGLVKMEAINRKFSLKKLLLGYGCDMSRGNMFCPFHPDSLTGKPSAKYHEADDTLFCFSESKTYSAYHALKLLYGVDTNKLFWQLWPEMPLDERHEIMDMYDSPDAELSRAKESPVWTRNKPALDKFKEGQITYHQMKNALYKTFLQMQEEQEGGVQP